MSEMNPENHTDHMWQMHMQTLTKMKKNMETARIIDEALFQYYAERGMNVPKWKQKQPDWWREYLIRLGLDPNNP